MKPTAGQSSGLAPRAALLVDLAAIAVITALFFATT
jgi:hypothetical protein